MKNRPWKIYEWGQKESDGNITNYSLTLDNDVRADTAKNRGQTTPLFLMNESPRYSRFELKEYAIKIRDALNAAGIVEGSIEDPDQPK